MTKDQKLHPGTCTCPACSPDLWAAGIKGSKTPGECNEGLDQSRGRASNAGLGSSPPIEARTSKPRVSDSELAGEIANLERLRLNPTGLSTREAYILLALYELSNRRAFELIRQDETAGDDARDAARYRFLRQPGNAIVYAKDRNAWGKNASGHVRYDTAEQLDAAVDAARGAEEPAREHLHWCAIRIGKHCNCHAEGTIQRLSEKASEPAPYYDWKCWSCGGANRAGTARCVNCGCRPPCSVCGEGKIHGPHCGYAGSPVGQ